MLQTDDMTVWKAQICAGNDCFDKNQLLSAIAHYQKAIKQAQTLIDSWEEPKAAVAALMVSYHNLADLYLRENSVLLAEYELHNAHQSISRYLTLAEPNSYRASALIWGVSQTYIALITHQKNQPNQVMTNVPHMPNLFETTFKNTLN
ncbi:MAG: hypothetical protein JKY14_09070 [Paraglaciecola sp.]|nr:hypothetical protein [Paraglaciecola sp.]